jgi:hypothetical protein
MEAGRRLAQAWCALAEHSMNEADDAAEVATECELLLKKARAMDPSSPEPLQVRSLYPASALGNDPCTAKYDSAVSLNVANLAPKMRCVPG